MNDAPRQTLRELIARHGPGLCGDPRRCEGLLRDLCGEHRREINILVGALRERVPLDLLAAGKSLPTHLLLTRLAKRLEDQLALTEAASRWAVDSWALALGIVSDTELEAFKSRRDEAAAPRIEITPKPPTPPRTHQSPTPPATQTPTASSPPATRPPVAPVTRINAQGSSTAAAPHRTGSRAPSSPRRANPGGPQEPSDPAAATRGGTARWRGCLVGCILIALLSVLLAVGVPFVVNILREEQQQRNLEPPPVQTR
jgi:hypothetical protein